MAQDSVGLSKIRIAQVGDGGGIEIQTVGTKAMVQLPILNAYVLYEDYYWRITEDAKLTDCATCSAERIKTPMSG